MGRTKNERTGLFRNLVQSLIFFEKIETTEAKSKAIKGLVDKVINQAKSENTRRLLSQFLVNKKAQEKLINELLPRLQSRNSGYTSTVKLGRRLGDRTMVVQIRLLLEETKPVKSVSKKESKESVESKESEVKKPTRAKRGESRQ